MNIQSVRKHISTDKTNNISKQTSNSNNDFGEHVPLKQAGDERKQHIESDNDVCLGIDPPQKSVVKKQVSNGKPTEKIHLRSLILTILLWLVFILVIFIKSVWIWMLLIISYSIYLMDCFCIAGTPFYLENSKTPNESKAYINTLIEEKPSITWNIRHFHLDSGVLTLDEPREIHYNSCIDKSEYFDLNQLDTCRLMRLKIVMNQTDVEFIDETSSEYYNDAYQKTLKFTKRRDEEIMIVPRINLASLYAKTINDMRLKSGKSIEFQRYEERFMVKNNATQSDNWKLQWSVYCLCCFLTISYIYRKWLDTICVCRQITLRKPIELNQKFPYCFDSNSIST